MANQNRKRPNGKGNGKSNGNGKTKNRVRRSGITPRVRVPEKKLDVQWGQDSCTVTGQDFLQTLQFSEEPTGNRNEPGAIILCQMMNPWRLPGSRLTQFANLFQRFCFRVGVIRYIPAVPATSAGQLIMAFDTDPTYAPIGSAQGVLKAMMAHKNRQVFHVYDDMKVVLPPSLKPEYYCDAQGQDIRLNNQAVFWVAVMASVLNMNGDKWLNPVGSFVIEWSVMFRTARIAQMQKTSFSDCTTYEVDYNTGYGDVPYNLLFITGARPTTQTSIVIIRGYTDEINGIERGAVYYIGTRQRDASDHSDFLTCLFGTLRAAQQFDLSDVIPLTSPPASSGETIDLCFTPVGPEVGSRANLVVQSDLTSGTSNSDEFGIELCNLEFPDRRYQAGTYLVNYTGVAPADSTAPGVDANAASLFYDDPTGLVTLHQNDECYLKPKISVAKIKSVLGLTDLEIDNLWGTGSSSKRFLSVLITALGFAVRALSILTTVVRVGMAIKREVQLSDEQFLAKVRLDTPFMVSARAGTHLGYTLTVTPNALTTDVTENDVKKMKAKVRLIKHK